MNQKQKNIRWKEFIAGPATGPAKNDNVSKVPSDVVGPVGPLPVRGGQRDQQRRPTFLLLEVEGVPKPQPRARSRKGMVGVYTPDNANDWKRNIRATCKAMLKAEGWAGLIPLAVPLRVDMTFRFPRPASHFRTGRYAGQLKPSAPVYYVVSKPDRDNLDKAVLDALTRFDKCPALIWCDDCQAADGRIIKRYVRPGEAPGVSVAIYDA